SEEVEHRLQAHMSANVDWQEDANVWHRNSYAQPSCGGMTLSGKRNSKSGESTKRDNKPRPHGSLDQEWSDEDRPPEGEYRCLRALPNESRISCVVRR